MRQDERHPTADAPPGKRDPGAGYRQGETGPDVTRQNVQAMRRLEEDERARRTGADRIAAAIAGFCGSMTFVVIHVIFFGSWIVYNTLPWFDPFDPYPFTFLTLVVSLEAIFLATFILISQNYDMRITERRNQLDLQIDLLAEQEDTKILQLLERIAKKVGAQTSDDPQVRALEQGTRPDALAKQIEEEYRAGKKPPPGTKSQGPG